MDGSTNNKELVEFVLRESPPVVGAAALGANMIGNVTIDFKCLNENGTDQWAPFNRNKAAQMRFAECAKLLGTLFIRPDIFSPSLERRSTQFYTSFVCPGGFCSLLICTVGSPKHWAKLLYPDIPSKFCRFCQFKALNIVSV